MIDPHTIVLDNAWQLLDTGSFRRSPDGMFMDTYYPEIDAGYMVPFEIVISALKNDPLWLEREGCPYDKATKDALREMYRKTRAVDREREKENEDGSVDYDIITDDQLERDLAKLHRDLKTFKDKGDAEGGGDIQYFRVAVSLMTKLVELRERMAGVKSVGEFTSKIYQVFENVLTPEQCTQAIEMLGGKNGTPKVQG